MRRCPDCFIAGIKRVIAFRLQGDVCPRRAASGSKITQKILGGKRISRDGDGFFAQIVNYCPPGERYHPAGIKRHFLRAARQALITLRLAVAGISCGISLWRGKGRKQQQEEYGNRYFHEGILT